MTLGEQFCYQEAYYAIVQVFKFIMEINWVTTGKNTLVENIFKVVVFLR